MKICRECGKAVSTSAQECPHCGCIAPTAEALSFNRTVMIVMVVVVLAVVIFICGPLIGLL